MPDTSSLITDAASVIQTYSPDSWQESIKHAGPAMDAAPRERAWDCYYDSAKYDGEKFRRKVRRLADDLGHVLDLYDADAIVVHGTSGTSVAFGLQALRDLPLVMVRKPGEYSHGHTVEGNVGRFRRYVFLDDFVSTGSTVQRVMGLLTKAEMVGLWLHQGAEENGYKATAGAHKFYDRRGIVLPCFHYIHG